MKENDVIYDCVIIGGGAAGLTASMVLARSCRTVLLIDAGNQSNKVTSASHNVFSRDGSSPENLYAIAHEQLQQYPQVKIVSGTATHVTYEENIFTTQLEHEMVKSRTVLLAQGAQYVLPSVPGLDALWGTKIWHCPYCDGYEAQGKTLFALGSVEWIDHMSVILPTWSKDITWISTDNSISLETEQRILNSRGKIGATIVSIENIETGIKILDENNRIKTYDQGIVETLSSPRDSIAQSLGCECDSGGHISCDIHGKSSLDGLYVAGDQGHVEHQINMVVASGHKAAMSINVFLSVLEREEETR